MITEADVRGVLALLPYDSFIRQYADYASSQVSSHLGYHVACALGLVAVSAKDGAVTRGFKKTTFPNFYSLIVGPSGEAEKTLAVDILKELMAETFPALEGSDPTAEETLTKILSTRPQLLFVYPEMGSFLAKTGGKDQRGQAIRAGFTDYFDGLSRTREYSKGAPVVVTNPRVSFLGACTPRHLEEHTTSLDWEGGFMSRFFVVYGDRERDIPWPSPNPQLREYLANWLRWARFGDFTFCPGEGIESDAAELWVTWQREMNATYRDRMKDERVRGVISRTRLIAAKCTFLVALSNLGLSPGWKVNRATMEAGIGLAGLHLKSALGLVERIAPTPEMREQKDVLDAIGGEWTPLGEVLLGAHLTKKRAEPYIETLICQGKVAVTVQDTTHYYRKVVGGKPRPYDLAMEGLAVASTPLPPPPPPPPPFVSPAAPPPVEGEVPTEVVSPPVDPWDAWQAAEEAAAGATGGTPGETVGLPGPGVG